MLRHYRLRLPTRLAPCNPLERQLAEQILPLKLAHVLPLAVLIEKYEQVYMQHPDLIEELTETVVARLELEEQRLAAADDPAFMMISHRADLSSTMIRD